MKKEKTVNNVPVIVYVDENRINVTTDKNGAFIIEYPTTKTDENYVEVFYEGNEAYTDCINTSIFYVNKISTTTTAQVVNTEVDNVTISVIIKGKDGKTINSGNITIHDENNKVVSENRIISDKTVIKLDSLTSGTHTLKIEYEGNYTYNPSNTIIKITPIKKNVTVKVDSIKGIIGEKITLTAHVLDEKGNPVSGGNLVFKLNSKTLRTDGRFDSTAPVWKFKVENGRVSTILTADLYLRNAKNLTTSYSGSYKYNEAKSSIVTAQIKKRNAKISVTATPTKQKQYNTITFKAKLTDITPGYKNTTAMNTGTKVLFKINGKSMKNAKGNNILVKVVNNTATYKYTVPAGMGGITKDGQVRNYTVEALLVSNTYYPDTRAESTFNVKRSSITINIAKVSVNSKKQLNVKASIKDYKGKNVVGTNTVAIKINGKTYVNPKTHKNQYFKITNGKIDLKGLQLSKKINLKKVTIVTGARQAYLGARNSTSNIVKA